MERSDSGEETRVRVSMEEIVGEDLRLSNQVNGILKTKIRSRYELATVEMVSELMPSRAMCPLHTKDVHRLKKRSPRIAGPDKVNYGLQPIDVLDNRDSLYDRVLVAGTLKDSILNSFRHMTDACLFERPKC